MKSLRDTRAAQLARKLSIAPAAAAQLLTLARALDVPLRLAIEAAARDRVPIELALRAIAQRRRDALVAAATGGLRVAVGAEGRALAEELVRACVSEKPGEETLDIGPCVPVIERPAEGAPVVVLHPLHAVNLDSARAYAARGALSFRAPEGEAAALIRAGACELVVGAQWVERECRQCGCPPPALQHFACALCGYPTLAADAGAGAPPPIDPTVRASLVLAVAERVAAAAMGGAL